MRKMTEEEIQPEAPADNETPVPSSTVEIEAAELQKLRTTHEIYQQITLIGQAQAAIAQAQARIAELQKTL